MAEPIVVVHEPQQQRFCVRLEGQEAWLEYRREGPMIDLYHIYVPEAFRGRGIAERLCQAAFEYAQQERLTVIPSCPYISGTFLRRHPEHAPGV